MPTLLRMEIPSSLPKGSVVYLQNIVTDLTMGLKNGSDVIGFFIKTITKMGYVPGLITLNPSFVFDSLKERYADRPIHLCFNLNVSGFNVFPSNQKIEETIEKIKLETKWSLMAMSIFSSGSKNIPISESIKYIKRQNLDYLVFGSSNLGNIEHNQRLLNE